jgi:hypothetical protein
MVLGHKSRGYRLLGQHWWSGGAIVAFAKALYYRRGLDLGLIGALLSAVFGRPIYVFARRTKERLSAGRARSDR